MRVAAATTFMLALQAALAAGEGPIRVIAYDPDRVIHVPVARGVATHVQFEEGEKITSAPAAGLASVCRTSKDSTAQAEVAPDAWDLCAPRDGRNLFIKPVGTSRLSNTVAVVTDRRAYSFSFDVAGNPAQAVQRLTIAPPKAPEPDPVTVAAQQKVAMAMAMVPKEDDLIRSRMALPPLVRNANYTVALGKNSEDARPVAVFDDGRATYFLFAGNRLKPAVFRVEANGQEVQANETYDLANDYIVVDSVARGWTLRLGADPNSPVASITNQAYDPHGVPPVNGSTVEGVRRVVRDPRTGKFEEPRQ